MSTDLTPAAAHPPTLPQREPVADLEPRLRELGRLRLGHQVATSNGRARPAALERFRLTSPEPALIHAAADLWGGRPQPWTADGRDEHQVVVDADAIDAAVPPVGQLSTGWELWSGGGCQRRCDGRVERLTGQPCAVLCPPAGEARAEAAADGQACTPVSRLNVLLPDLPGFGVWRLESHGYHAAVELAGAAQLFDLAASRGQLLRVRLRIDRRHIKRPGQPRRDFVVPVVEIPQTLGEVLAAAGVPLPDGTPAAALDAPAPAGVALPAGAQHDELPPMPPPPDDEPHEGTGRALLASRAQAAGVTPDALDALLRARYGAHDGLDAMDDGTAAEVAGRLAHPGLLARFVAAAAADLRAEHADAAGQESEVPF